MTASIRLRRATAASWTSVNPILALGEMGVETDTYKLKVGDGVSQWTALAYFVHSWADVTGKPAVIASGATQSDARSAISAASLDVNGKVPVAELPSSIMQYQGTYDASTNTPSLVNGTGDIGDVYRVTVAGSRNFGAGAISFGVGDYVILNSSLVWEKSDTTDAVSTVAGRVGDVVLTVADIGGNTTTALGVGSLNVGHASDTQITRVSAGRIAVAGANVVLAGGAGQVADVCLVAFGKDTARAAGTGDNPFGVKLQRAVTFSSVTYRAATADASGNLVVELRKNGTAVSGSSATIAAASQITGGSASGSWAFASGDILTVQVTGVGTTPGKGLVADITGLTT